MANHKYTQEHIDFLSENVKGRYMPELTDMFNKKFNLNLKVSAIRSALYQRGLKNGIDCRLNKGYEPTQFKKGHAAWNKGLKGINFGGKETQFKPGHKPINYRPVGSERINADGYTEVKIADPKTWRAKHIVLWEEKNGPVPKGYAIIFADSNKSNLAIDNLLLVSRRELLILNSRKLIKNDADLTRTGVLIADIHIKVAEIKKKK